MDKDSLAPELEKVFIELVAEEIPFKIHYPSKGGIVVTVSDSVNNQQLKVLTNLGASMGPNGILQLLLFTEH